MEILLFYALALGALAAALGVVLARSPMTSVVSLLGCFVCLAVVYLMAGFQFMAAIQILVYAGAIMVLFLFVIMLLDLAGPGATDILDPAALRRRRMPLALAVCAGLLALALAAIYSGEALVGPDPALEAAGIDSTLGLATLVFGRYLLAFEAAGFLLLAATVGVLVLAKRQRSLGGEELTR